jgi:phage terminase large subunit GpA-like protein
VLYQRLALTQPGPGYIHTSNELEDAWYAGLTAEQLVTRYVKGRPRSEWMLKKGQRNEPLDLWVYGYAAAAYLGMTRWKAIDWGRLAAKIEPPLFDPDLAPAAAPEVPRETAQPAGTTIGAVRRVGRIGKLR